VAGVLESADYVAKSRRTEALLIPSCLAIPDVVPDLRRADLTGADLTGVDLNLAILAGTAPDGSNYLALTVELTTERCGRN
jgi:uncharacterized protein YjbI with pentapeptide repeats